MAGVGPAPRRDPRSGSARDRARRAPGAVARRSRRCRRGGRGRRCARRRRRAGGVAALTAAAARDPSRAGGARRRGGGRRRAGGRAREPGARPLVDRGGRAPASRRPRGVRAHRARSAAGSPPSGTAALLAAGVLVVGPGPAAFLALAGPGGVAWMLAARRARYRRAVEGGLAPDRHAIADALAGGRSARAALASAAASVEGPPAAELARVARRPGAGGLHRRGLQRAARPPAVDPGRLVRHGAPLPAAQRRRPRRAPATVRRLGGGTRPGRGRRPIRHRAGTVHGAAGGRDADRRGAVRRADRAGVRAVAALECGIGHAARGAAGLQLAGFAAIRRLSRIEDA